MFFMIHLYRKYKDGEARIMTNLYLPFYFEWINIIRVLPDEEYGRLTRAVFDYAMGRRRKRPTFSPDAEMAYKFITAAISRSELKRHASAKENDTKKAKKKENKTFRRVERTAEEKKMESAADMPRDSESSEPQSKDIAVKEERKKAPSADEVRGFFKNRNFKSNPDEFFNFYESKGWMVGQNPMQNWHSSAENWELRAEKEKKFQNETDEPKRHGDFDVHEAFRLAIERSYGTPDEDEE